MPVHKLHLQSLVLLVLLVLLFLLSALTGVAQMNNVQPRVVQAIDEHQLVPLRGNTHPLARAQYDRGIAPGDLPAERILLLLQRGADQEAALRQLLDEQQTNSSPNYHRWLTPAEFGRRFGPADADIQAVTGWLASKGFQVNRVAAGRTVIEFSGTAGLVRRAFHTEIHKFVVNGQEHWANASDPQIPAALAPVVAGIVSLHNFPKKPASHQLGAFRRDLQTGEIRPAMTVKNNSGTTYYPVGPGDFATIYNAPPLSQVPGSGQTIAVVAESNISTSDLVDFRNLFGLPFPAWPVFLDGPDPGLTNDESEAVLDMEWAGAVAPFAEVELVVSRSTETTAGIDLSAASIVDNDLAPVLSESYSACEASLLTGGNQFYQNLWEQAAAQGITVVVAAGDNGSAGCDNPDTESVASGGLGINGIAATPFNVAVGGTDFNDASSLATYWNATNTSGSLTSAKSYIPEMTWNDTCASTADPGNLNVCASSSNLQLWAGSGGASNCSTTSSSGSCLSGTPKPYWQTGPGVPSDGVRDIPDVSFFAASGSSGSNSFYVLCQADALPAGTTSCTPTAGGGVYFLGASGTSVSAPVFAATVALAVQKAGTRLGNVNYLLYSLAAQSGNSCNSSSLSSSCIFHDVTIGNNSVPCAGGSADCSSGAGTGVLIDSKGNPAYRAAADYDLATGLGSVNVSNLVNALAGDSTNFTPTTTSLALNGGTTEVTATHGTPVNIAVNVSPPAASGNVSLIGSPGRPTNNQVNNMGITFSTVFGGAAVWSSAAFLGGNYYVHAHYAGDGTYAASDSASIPVVISPEASSTLLRLVTFDIKGNPIYTSTTTPYGSPYVLRADVTNSAGTACGGLSQPSCPTGEVSLTNNSFVLDASLYALNIAGYAEDQTVQLPAGSHSLQATYWGDAGFNSSTSKALFVSITKAPTSLTAPASNPQYPALNTAFNITATVNTQSSGVAPTGIVTFFANGQALNGTIQTTPTVGSAKGPASLQTTMNTTFAAAGSYNIAAAYSGDANYQPASSPVGIIEVGADFSLPGTPTSVTIGAPGQAGSTSITVAPVNGFTGQVSFACSVPAAMREASCSAGPVSITGSSQVTATVTIITTAPHIAAGLRHHFHWFLASGGTILAGVFFIGFPAFRRRRSFLIGCFLVALLAGSIGCGGGGGGGGGGIMDQGTPAGTYSVTLTGMAGNLAHSTSLPVTVQ